MLLRHNYIDVLCTHCIGNFIIFGESQGFRAFCLVMTADARGVLLFALVLLHLAFGGTGLMQSSDKGTVYLVYMYLVYMYICVCQLQHTNISDTFNSTTGDLSLTLNSEF